MDLATPNEWRGVPLTESSSCPHEQSDAPAPVDIVIVIAVDGLSANDIEEIVLSKDSESGQYSAEYQYMQWMMEHGASTLDARLEMPATPLVGAASLLFGTTPEVRVMITAARREFNSVFPCRCMAYWMMAGSLPLLHRR